jgi:hypothetical protein
LRYSNDVERVTNIYKVDGPVRSPWRVVMIGRDLNTLVNSDLVNNLSDPPDKTLFPAGAAQSGSNPAAHQLATAAIFNEPLLTYGAHPTNLLQHAALPSRDSRLSDERDEDRSFAQFDASAPPLTPLRTWAMR